MILLIKLYNQNVVKLTYRTEAFPAALSILSRSRDVQSEKILSDVPDWLLIAREIQSL